MNHLAKYTLILIMDISNHLVSMKVLVEQLDLSESTIRRMICAGDFPPGLKIACGCVRWRNGDVLKWLKDVELQRG